MLRLSDVLTAQTRNSCAVWVAARGLQTGKSAIRQIWKSALQRNSAQKRFDGVRRVAMIVG